MTTDFFFTVIGVWSSFKFHTFNYLGAIFFYLISICICFLLMLPTFLFSIIRQQLTNTEDIRRVRKKAPCTVPEIVMLQRQALEDGLFKEPIFTGKFMTLKCRPFYTRSVDCSYNLQLYS